MLPPVGRFVAACFLALVTSGFGLVFVAATRGSHERQITQQTNSLPPVSRPVTRDKADVDRFIGVILPHEAVDVTAQLEGHVEQCPVRIGQSVHSGELLALLGSVAATTEELEVARADLNAAEAEVRRLTLRLAEARERLARTELSSTDELRAPEKVQDAQIQERLAAAALSSGESAVDQKQAVLKQHAALVARLQVRAPFDGVVSMRYVDRGAIVGPGTPLVHLVQTWPLRLRFAVPGSESRRLRIGAIVNVSPDDSSVRLTGRIERIAPEIESASNMIVVEASLNKLDNLALGDQGLLVGQSARVLVAQTADSTPRDQFAIDPAR